MEMNEIGFLTCSKCQHGMEDTERAREAQGEGGSFCLLGVVSGGRGEKFAKFSWKESGTERLKT